MSRILFGNPLYFGFFWNKNGGLDPSSKWALRFPLRIPLLYGMQSSRTWIRDGYLSISSGCFLISFESKSAESIRSSGIFFFNPVLSLLLINLLFVKETKTEETAEMQGNKSSGAKEGSNKRQSRREKKIALQHDVPNLIFTPVI